MMMSESNPDYSVKSSHNQWNTYEQSGVNIDKGDAAVQRIASLAKKTSTPQVISSIGGFNGLFALGQSYQNPVLVSSTDGVGTKLKIALDLNKHHSIGIDLVAMCVNDILTCSAKPLFFLDYFATSKLNSDVLVDVVKGISQACLQCQMALLGGETAEMPGIYSSNDYDLAGFVVGIVERNQLIDGSMIREGDQILGIPSNGFHSNGYSLLRYVLLEQKKMCLDEFISDLNLSLGELLLRPTQIYYQDIQKIKTIVPIKGMAHITGGGLISNTQRILPSGLDIQLYPRCIPDMFTWVQEIGHIANSEMHRVFNMGVGMTVVVNPDDVIVLKNEFPLLINVGTVVPVA